MRILVVTNLFPPHHIGGYELRCREVVERLRGRGHAVRVLTSRYRTARRERPEPYVTRTLSLSWGPPYPPEDLPGLLACECTDRTALAKMVTEFRPDVIDVWGMEFASQPLAAELLGLGVPVHLTLEDVWLASAFTRDPLCGVTQVARELGIPTSAGIRRLCPLGLERPPVGDSSVSFTSHALRDNYGVQEFGQSRVRLAGINTSRFAKLGPSSPPPPFVVLSVGQVAANRGQADLIEAAATASQGGGRWPTVVRIVGPATPDYATRLSVLARRHSGQRFGVELAGILPLDELRCAYAGAHLFVQTSHLPEGLPRVLMEALSAGVPVIATDTGGQRDILDQGRWGRLVPPARPDVLAEAIREAMDNRPEWLTRARAAREHALTHFDIEDYVDDHERHLRDIAAVARHAKDPPLADLPSRDEIRAWSQALGERARCTADLLDVSSRPEDAWRLGAVLKRTGRFEAAEGLFRQLLKAFGDNPTHVRRATFHLAEIALIEGCWERAAELLNECLKAAPDHRKAAQDLAAAERRRVPPHLDGLCRAVLASRA